MDEKNTKTLRLMLIDADENVIASVDAPYDEFLNFRRKTGAPPSMLLENMLVNLESTEQNSTVHLPPRKPGESNFNR